MMETGVRENPGKAQNPPVPLNLQALIQPNIEEILIDRFFQGDAESYSLFIEILDSVKSWTEAEELINEEATRRGVHPTTLPAMKLKRLLKRKFGVL
ncbi:MAG: hypothetical protein ALAOOOJD_01904 [bacterium]|nr:hypothetical protein [bacterium]